MGAGSGPFPDDAHLPIALENPNLHIVEVKRVEFLARRLEHVGPGDERSGHLLRVELPVPEDFSFDANGERLQSR